MGNWHCIPNGCGRVIYREYLPPQIRFRYENEDWQYIDGDDYELNQPAGQCADAVYAIRGFATYQYPSNSVLQCGDVISISTFNIQAKIFDFNVRTDFFAVDVTLEYQNGNRETVTYGFIGSGYDRRYPGQQKKANTGRLRYGENCTGFGFGSRANNITQLRIVRVDGGEDNCGDCTLTIKKDEEIVHQEIRDTCPEVEKLPCRLSNEQKVIEIKKIPFLERLEVVDYEYDVRLGYLIDNNNDYGFLLVKRKIPNECLSIYKNNIASTIPNNFYQIANTSENNYQLIAQICSAPNCLPPEYNVECDCDCEKCPPETCPLTCGDRICCYDDYGKSIKEIPIDKYCEDKL